MENSAEQTRIIDKVLQVNLAYWSILIAINGIIVSVLSIISALKGINILFVLLISIPSIISCVVLINNFQKTLYQYKLIMKRLSGPEISQKQKDKDIKQAKLDHDITQNNTKKALIFLFVQIAILFIPIIIFGLAFVIVYIQ
jgi:hypothetical protein